jgi:hypothetical protein
MRIFTSLVGLALMTPTSICPRPPLRRAFLAAWLGVPLALGVCASFAACSSEPSPSATSDAAPDPRPSPRDASLEGNDALAPSDGGTRDPYGWDAAPIEGGIPRGTVFPAVFPLPDGGLMVSANAAFGYYTDGDCTQTVQGACTVTTCPNQSERVLGEVPAGSVTFTGSFLPPAGLVLLPDARGHYRGNLQMPVWVGGEVVTITASGGAVPAFRDTMTMPKRITITTPTFVEGQTLRRDEDIVLQWTGGEASAGQLTVFLIGQTSTVRAVRAECTYPVSNGTATVPAAALSKLAPGSYAVRGAVRTLKAFKSGTFDITLSPFAYTAWGGTAVLQ